MTGYTLPSGRYCRSGNYVVTPKADPAWRRTLRLIIIAAVVTSAPWAYLLHSERELHAKLLTEVQSRQPRVEQMTMRYSDGARQQIAIKEAR